MTATVSLPLLPVYLVDALGSSLMIVLAVAALIHVRRLQRLEPANFLWTFFFWLTLTLTALAFSRSFWHLLRYLFILGGHREIWQTIRPYSGGINTIAFCTAAVAIFYYQNTERVVASGRREAEALRLAHAELARANSALGQLNQTLEERVARRTEELQLSEAKFRRLFEASKDMILFCDGEGRVCDINDSGLELLGAAHRNEVIGQPFTSFFLSQEKGRHFRSEILSQGHVKEFECQLKGPADSQRYLMLTAVAMRNEAGEVQGCQVIAIDLSHFKKMTDQLVQSEKMTSVGQLAAGVAHEINTPLGIILGYTQLLAEDFADNPEVHETLAIIEKHTKICRRIVADLLKFSHPSAEQQMRPGDINRCLEEVLSIVEHTLNMDHIFIHRCLAADIPLVLFDPERLRQVFVNLLTNAHHAIGEEGIVGVWSRHHPERGEVEIIIGDTGKGIPPETMSRIFDPFFTTKGVGKGTGLGLSVSFGIINDHNGRIEAYSPPQDQELLAVDMHTAFHVHLPLATGEEEA
ncbi:MAG: ATP-binding protein [Thermodesulfobacteriota bacterium]